MWRSVFEVVKIDVAGRAGRVVRVEHRLDRPLADHRRRDRPADPVAGHVEDLRVEDLRLRGADAAQIAALQPLAGDALQLAEQEVFRVAAGIAELR
ncbi:MAG TPA: hypothetical protein VFC56_01805 [Stellaceae bacterium]|nr:hypothetical protein [Stellaceae bacterium]